nr:retrotransposon protein, putative, Ty1-copia subclass [Tanacetum cinerariifolium]
MVKKIRIDNGLEFFNQEFEQLCIESGIARHLTVVEMPQPNGLAERMNKTLMDKVCCLLIQFGLLKTFWAEATYTAAYPINRSPSTAIEKKTPMEMWSGHPSDYGIIRIFGCVALDDESPKIVTNKNVVFNESVMYKDMLKDSGPGVDKSVEELQVELILDREPRTRTKPLRFRDESNMAAYSFAVIEKEDTHEPLTYKETFACEDSSKWKAAMKEEMNSLRKKKTWELVDHPARQKLVSCEWLFKIKKGIKGVQNPRYKLDVKTEFLHRNIEEMIYMRQPLRYESGNNLCLLKKFLYGLKRSPRKWYRRFDDYMLSNRFKRSSYNNCVYYKSYAPGEYIYLLLYVDDMLIADNSKAEIRSTKFLLKKEFDMKDLKETKKTLGMEIVKGRSRKILMVSQSGHVSKILNNLRIDNGKSVKMPLGRNFKLSLKDCPIMDCDVERMSKVLYANAVGSLMYLMVCTRPDITYAVSVASRYLANLEVLEAKTVTALKVGTEHNVTDALTKVVPGLKLQHCLELMNVGVG